MLHDAEGFELRSENWKAVREAWGWAMAGGYYSFFTRDRDFDRVGDSGWQQAIRHATTLRQVMESVRFWEMSPVDSAGDEYDSLVSQGPGDGGWQVFAAPGREYLVYCWGTPRSRDLVIDIEPGEYSWEWIDARDGLVLLSGELANAGDNATIVAPADDSWDGRYGVVLAIRSLVAEDDGGDDGATTDEAPDGGDGGPVDEYTEQDGDGSIEQDDQGQDVIDGEDGGAEQDEDGSSAQDGQGQDTTVGEDGGTDACDTLEERESPGDTSGNDIVSGDARTSGEVTAVLGSCACGHGSTRPSSLWLVVLLLCGKFCYKRVL